jgi:hypothetical protein
MTQFGTQAKGLIVMDPMFARLSLAAYPQILYLVAD